VFFADIDFSAKPSRLAILAVSLVLWIVVAVGLKVGFDQTLTRSIMIGFAAALFLGYAFASGLQRAMLALNGGHEGVARKRIAAFLAQRPDWRLRVYRTPAGLRLLALHRLFDPREADVTTAFDALGVDPTYARMCSNQNCFRARLTPKPWRLGLPRLRPPYAAAWRLEHAELPGRREWIAEYGRASEGRAACRFVETLGSGRVDAVAEHVQQLHDLMCQAERDLPLA
jgi:hypothetical protein